MDRRDNGEAFGFWSFLNSPFVPASGSGDTLRGYGHPGLNTFCHIECQRSYLVASRLHLCAVPRGMLEIVTRPHRLLSCALSLGMPRSEMRAVKTACNRH